MPVPPGGRWVLNKKLSGPALVRFDHVVKGSVDWVAFVEQEWVAESGRTPFYDWYYAGGRAGPFPTSNPASLCSDSLVHLH